MALFEEVHDERRRMGWEDFSDCPWVIGPSRNKQERDLLIKKCVDADVMVFGACPMEVLKARIAANKFTFVASERLLKKQFYRLRMLNPRYAIGFKRYCSLVNHPHVHALTIGYYAPGDLRTLGAFDARIWKWGYFVDVCREAPKPVPDRPLKVLWAGRMLKWKKIDDLLRALARVTDPARLGECVLIGEGPDKKRLLRLARQLQLDKRRVRFQPPVPFGEVRRIMRDSDVYVLASNRQEGWGAVAGEAMSEGCVLVANEQAGAARELVVEGETGFLYQNENIDQLASLLEIIANNHSLRMRVRKQAWERMNALWSPRVAAERLVALSKLLLGHSPIPDFLEGPCSKV